MGFDAFLKIGKLLLKEVSDFFVVFLCVYVCSKVIVCFLIERKVELNLNLCIFL